MRYKSGYEGVSMRISEESITKLRELLKHHIGSEYDEERAQKAGRAILRLAGIKLYQLFEEEKDNV